MVIGKERSTWYADHGPACTCVDCVARNADQRRFDNVTQGRKVGRNEICPCGSGKKFKKCHGG
jgi:preprotein translocase subunit SecA